MTDIVLGWLLTQLNVEKRLVLSSRCPAPQSARPCPAFARMRAIALFPIPRVMKDTELEKL